SIGAVTWIQELPPGQRFQDRRQQVRRQVLDRRGAYRHNVSVPERRYGGGRRRDDFGLGRENWRGLVL
ncbi:MAG: hypothetical protein OIF38_14240, partial [Cellvibrionaceae bacterium]|nr:hypothetical protein [Cellvibrionaceae bacterium]